MPEAVKKLSNGYIKVLGSIFPVTPYLNKSYISIAPLRFGAGMKGKVVEAMAHGIPVVTTLIGIQGMDVKHGDEIMLADKPEDFAKNIIELISNPVLYNKLSINSINYIKNNLTPDKVRHQITRIFDA